MRSKNSIKQIIIVSIASLCVGLMLGSLIGSWVWGLAAFAIVLCIGLSPADFGLGRKNPKPPLEDDDEL